MVAEQLELPPRQERCVAQLEQLRRSVVPAVGAAREREADAPPRRALGEREHGGIVGVQDPDALRRGVVEQQPLVVVVGGHRRVAVEVVGREVRKDADVGGEVRAVVQLERGHLDGEPVIAVAPDGDVRERPADVARGRGAHAGGLEHVRHERRRGGLAVRPGDRDAARALQRGEADLDLRHDRHTRCAGGGDGRCARRHAGRDDDGGGGADLRQVVAAQLHLHPRERPQLGERVAAVRAVGRVARVHVHALPREQSRGRDAALPQPHDRHDAPAPSRGNHLTFSVASAIAAHSTPRM